MECPVCNKEVAENIEIHVEKCIFLHTQEEPTMNDKNKRRSHTLEAPEKRFKENDGTSTSRKSPVFDNKRKVKDTNNGVQGTNFFKTNKVIQLSDDDDDDDDEDTQPVMNSTNKLYSIRYDYGSQSFVLLGRARNQRDQ